MKIYFTVLAISLLATLVLIGGVQAQFTKVGALSVDLVKYDPFPAESGKYVKVFVNVRNAGFNDIENVVCEIVEEYPFSTDSETDRVESISILNGLTSALFEFRVRIASNAIEGDTEIPLKCTMNDGSSSATSKLRINIESNSPEFAIGTVKPTPKEIKAGLDDIKVEVELQNIGEGDAKLVTAELGLPEGFEPSDSYSNVDNLGSIPKDGSKTAVFYIDTEDELKAGSYSGELVLRYKDGGNGDGYITRLLMLNLNVKASPSFDVTSIKAGTKGATSSDGFTGYIVKDNSIVSPSTLAQGGSAELRITLVNNGEEKAESLSVKIFKDATHPFTFDEVFDFIGSLEVGESADVVFPFSIDADAALKKYMLDLEIRYVDGSEVRTVDKTIPIEVTQATGDTTFIYAAAIPLIIILGALVYWRRKR